MEKRKCDQNCGTPHPVYCGTPCPVYRHSKIKKLCNADFQSRPLYKYYCWCFRQSVLDSMILWVSVPVIL